MGRERREQKKNHRRGTPRESERNITLTPPALESLGALMMKRAARPYCLSSQDFLSLQDDAYEKSPRHRAHYNTLAARRRARRSPPPRLRRTLRPRPLATSLGLYLRW